MMARWYASATRPAVTSPAVWVAAAVATGAAGSLLSSAPHPTRPRPSRAATERWRPSLRNAIRVTTTSLERVRGPGRRAVVHEVRARAALGVIPAPSRRAGLVTGDDVLVMEVRLEARREPTGRPPR